MLNKIEKISLPDELVPYLDEDQMEAVCAPLGNTITLAGPGSGKTRVLAFRVIAMIYSGVPAEHIRVLAFADRARAAALEQIGQLARRMPKYEKKRGILGGLSVRTIHGNMIDIVNHYQTQAGYRFSCRTALSAQQAVDKMEEARAEYLSIYGKGYPESGIPSAKVLYEIMEWALNNHKTLTSALEEEFKDLIQACRDESDEEGSLRQTIRHAVNIIRCYVHKMLYEDRCYDLTMVQYVAVDILRNEEVRRQIVSNRPYVLVDEFQDVNWVQYEILSLLNGGASMFAVGDLNQTIYRFRGAVPGVADDFRKKAREIHLRYNYRSTPEITAFAQRVLGTGDLNRGPEMVSAGESSVLPCLAGQEHPLAGAQAIAEDILEHYADCMDRVAVLVRNRTEYQNVANVLKNAGISVYVDPKLRRQDGTIKKTLALEILQAVTGFFADPSDVSRYDVLLKSLGVKKQKLRERMAGRLADCEGCLAQYVPEYDGSKPKPEEARLVRLLEITEMDLSVGDKLRLIYEDVLLHQIRQAAAQSAQVEEEIAFYQNIADRFYMPGEFLGVLEEYAEEKWARARKQVMVIGVHQAKGREWDAVYLYNCSRNVYPYIPGGRTRPWTKEDEENERRLFFMACTRAREFLYISYSDERFNSRNKWMSGPSPFLEPVIRENGKQGYFYALEGDMADEDADLYHEVANRKLNKF